jgi:ribonuclease P protein component
MTSFAFSKSERLLNRKDFVNLKKLGKRLNTPHFTVIFKESGLGITRLGITVTKKVGNSTQRNRIKRLVREFYRLHKAHFPQGYDIVVTAKKGAHGLSLWKTKEELGEIILDKEFHV